MMRDETDWYERSKLIGRFRKLTNNEKQLVHELRDHLFRNRPPRRTPTS